MLMGLDNGMVSSPFLSLLLQVGYSGKAGGRNFLGKTGMDTLTWADWDQGGGKTEMI